MKNSNNKRGLLCILLVCLVLERRALAFTTEIYSVVNVPKSSYITLANEQLGNSTALQVSSAHTFFYGAGGAFTFSRIASSRYSLQFSTSRSVSSISVANAFTQSVQSEMRSTSGRISALMQIYPSLKNANGKSAKMFEFRHSASFGVGGAVTSHAYKLDDRPHETNLTYSLSSRQLTISPGLRTDFLFYDSLGFFISGIYTVGYPFQTIINVNDFRVKGDDVRGKSNQLGLREASKGRWSYFEFQAGISLGF